MSDQQIKRLQDAHDVWQQRERKIQELMNFNFKKPQIILDDINIEPLITRARGDVLKM